MDRFMKGRQIRRKVDAKDQAKVKNWKGGGWKKKEKEKKRETWRPGDLLDIGRWLPEQTGIKEGSCHRTLQSPAT
jgi:hypothetical protein